VKHIKVYEAYFPQRGDYRSTNPVQYISKNDISDVMTEIIDNFRCHEYSGDFEIIEKSHIRMGVLIKRAIKASYILEIPPSKMEYFEKCLKLVEWRFHSFFAMTNHTELRRHNILSMQLDKPQTIYQLVFEFPDCALEPDSPYPYV